MKSCFGHSELSFIKVGWIALDCSSCGNLIETFWCLLLMEYVTCVECVTIMHINSSAAFKSLCVTLTISIIDRINAIKMIFLPQILYLFRNIPILLPKSFFKHLDSIILPSLWNYKSHIIKKVNLCKPKHEGGLALPDFRFYYWPTHLQVFALWLEQSAVAPDLLRIEQDYCHAYDLGAVLLSLVILDQTAVNSIVIKSQLRVWRQIREYLKIKSLSLLIPIANNPSPPPPPLKVG